LRRAKTPTNTEFEYDQWAKALVAIGFSLSLLVLMGLSTIASSWFIVGHQPLTGLTGQLIAPGLALRLVGVAWLSALAPAVGFTALAILLSVVSRNPAVAIATPVVLGLVMQLVGALGGIGAIRPFLLTTPFETWHGLFASPQFCGPLWQGLGVSALWTAICLGTGYVVLQRRDFTGG
jgi:ABC-2 type transport system permease protein